MENSTSIRVLVVDDHPLMREGIASAIECEQDMALVATATNGDEAIAAFREHLPDVTLMDLQMPKTNGLEAIKSILAEFPQARIVVLTTYQHDTQAIAALRAGAAGYLLKNMLRKELIEAIRAVHSGRRRISAEIAAEIAEHATEDALSEREIEVLRRVASGGTNKSTAAQLGITEETVKTHMKSILAKLNAQDRTHAVTIAVQRGILVL
ncbi:MAG TPA: response regulator transcription factor [Steroidobacter sp.]